MQDADLAAPGADAHRRRFLKDLARWSAALALGGGVVALSRRGRGSCSGNGVCGGCPELVACQLPQASAARNASRPQAGS